MRKNWFAWVKKTRSKLERKTKTSVSHRDAMKAASETWPAEKAKLERKAARAIKRAAKAEFQNKT
jgi:hypothetical protein